MNRNYIDRHLTIDRYLQGKLAEDEQAEFEERLVWDQDLLDELYLAEKLQEGLRSSDLTKVHVARDDARPGRLSRAMTMPRYAAAASFVLGVLVTSLFTNNPDRGPGPGGIDAKPTSVVPLMVLRSADVQTIPVNLGGLTVLMVDVPLTYTSYKVSIRREAAAEPFWVQADLVPGYTDALAVGVPGKELAPAAYFLTVEGMDGDDTTFIQEIAFKTII